ncbi:hypothetical protein EDD15DRAFT_773838 [Pisolithus albus]|nr:hypothetical protein EDD15DRAFT_773838 [Pisolithus albus]
MLFTANDNATELRDWLEKLRVAETTYQTASAERKRLADMYNVITQESRALDQREREALANLRKFKATHSQLQDEANEEMPAGVAHLQTAKEEAEEEKKLVLQQFEDLAFRKTAINEAQNGLLTELNQVKKQIRTFEETRGLITVWIFPLSDTVYYLNGAPCRQRWKKPLLVGWMRKRTGTTIRRS